MPRIPSHGQSLFPGWLRPSSASAALIRAEDIDWQNLLTDAQGQADLQAFLSAQLGVYIQRIGGLTLSGDQIHLAYNDEAGDSQTVSVDLTSLAQGVVPVAGHKEGWEPTRVPTSDFGVGHTAIWVYQGADDRIQIGDEQGHVNGVLANSPGNSGAWRAGGANDLATFWARHTDSGHVNYASRDGLHSGTHRHETDNGQVYGFAATGEDIWLLLWDDTFNHVRLLTYPIDAFGAQDPVPNQTIPDTVITSDLPAGVTLPDDLGGLVHTDDNIYVLVRGEDDYGLPVTLGLAYSLEHPFVSRTGAERFFGVSSNVVDGYFTDDADWILQSHWLVQYEATTMLGHRDTPNSFGVAGYPLVVASSRTDTEFARIGAAAMGSPMAHIGDSIALAHDSLSPLTGVDYTDYEFLVVFVRDQYNRYSSALVVPYDKIDGLTATTETTLLAAGDNAIKTTGWLGSHEVQFGLVRQGATGLAIGQVHEDVEPMRISLVGEYTASEDVPNPDSHLTTIGPLPSSAPAHGLYGVSFGDESDTITWFSARDYLSKANLVSFQTPVTDANTVFLPGVVGRDVRLGKLRFQNETPPGNHVTIWVSHSGHSPWPLKLYRTWTSNITDLTVTADVYGLGRR